MPGTSPGRPAGRRDSPGRGPTRPTRGSWRGSRSGRCARSSSDTSTSGATAQARSSRSPPSGSRSNLGRPRMADVPRSPRRRPSDSPAPRTARGVQGRAWPSTLSPYSRHDSPANRPWPGGEPSRWVTCIVQSPTTLKPCSPIIARGHASVRRAVRIQPAGKASRRRVARVAVPEPAPAATTESTSAAPKPVPFTSDVRPSRPKKAQRQDSQRSSPGRDARPGDPARARPGGGRTPAGSR